VRPIEIAAAEEARHAGLLCAYGIRVLSAVARADGSGTVTFQQPTKAELEAIYRADPSLAQDLVLSYLACAVVGREAEEPLSPEDAALWGLYTDRWEALAGSSAHLAVRAELRATQFTLRHHAGLQRFAATLAYAGALMGDHLQARLGACFAPERAPVPLCAALVPWLAQRRAERKAAEAAERRSALKRATRQWFSVDCAGNRTPISEPL
jgi:hypothetical protein